MTRKLSVEVVGDSRGLERAFQRSSRAAKQFNNDIGRVGRGTLAGSGLFKSMGRNIAFASSAFLGGAGFVAATKNAITAASDLNEQISKTRQVFGQSADDIIAWSTTAADAFGQSQRQALATASSFGALFRPLGLTGKQAAEQSQKLTELGSDLASFYNTDVQDALDAIKSGIVGEAEPLRRYGVLLSETRVQQEAMAETGKKNAKQLTAQEKATARIALIFRDAKIAVGDYARTSGGLANQLRTAGAHIDDLQTQIGQLLIPVVTDVVNRFNDWISNTENQQRVLDTLKQSIGVARDVVNALRGAIEKLNDITGSTKRTVELLVGAFLVFKTARVVGMLAEIAGQIGLIGTRATGTTGKLVGPGSLRAALVGLTAAAWVITIKVAIEDIEDPSSIKRRAKRILDLVRGPLQNTLGGVPIFGTALETFVDIFNRVHNTADKSKDSLDALSVSVDQVKTKLTGMSSAAIKADAALQRAQKSAFAKSQSLRERGLLDGGAGGGGGGKRKPFRFGGSFLDLLQLRVDQAAMTKPLKDDLAAALRLQHYIERLIRRYGHTYKLEQQLLRAKQQVRGILDQQAQLDADELQKRKDAAKRAEDAAKRAQARAKALERQREAAKAALKARRRELIEERQQRFLETGSPFVPNVKALKRQLAEVRKALGNTIDTQTRQRLNRIAKILSGALGRVGKAMREQIKSDLDALRKDVDEGTGHIAYVTKLNLRKTLEGLGLTPAQRRALGGRLSGVGAAGVSSGTAAFAGQRGGVVITGDVHFHGVQNLRQFEEEVTKRHKARPSPRRGTR